MENKFTPQQWKLDLEIGDMPLKSLIRNLDGRLVARTYGIEPDEIEKNAKLIAVAPQLLSFVIEMAERYSNSEWITAEANKLIEKATK